MLVQPPRLIIEKDRAFSVDFDDFGERPGRALPLLTGQCDGTYPASILPGAGLFREVR
jgi:hypothetical protein